MALIFTCASLVSCIFCLDYFCFFKLLKIILIFSLQIAETCQLAIQRIQWLQSQHSEKSKLSENPFQSVDPAPPAEETSIEALRERLLDEKLSLFDRYRAMFALRNHNSEESVKALAEGKKKSLSVCFYKECRQGLIYDMIKGNDVYGADMNFDSQFEYR